MHFFNEKRMNFLAQGLVFVAFILPSLSVAQELTMPHYGEGEPSVKQHYNTTTLPDGEVVPWFLFPEVVISKKRIWTSEDARKQYFRLKYNVLKVLPYAIFAQKRYEQLDRDLAVTSDKKLQKKLVNDCESEIKTMFNKEIKNMTVSQGKILIKLVDRQTGHSSFEMVKEMKGGLTAFFYQGVARVFGHNLKSTYDPKQDFEIENIIRGFEKSRNAQGIY